MTNRNAAVAERDLKPFPTDCPPWCTVGEPGNRHARHLEYEATDRRPQERVHDGPKFGDVSTEARESLDAPGVLRITASSAPSAYGMDSEALRRLAADAVAAALWIERETSA